MRHLCCPRLCARHNFKARIKVYHGGRELLEDADATVDFRGAVLGIRPGRCCAFVASLAIQQRIRNVKRHRAAKLRQLGILALIQINQNQNSPKYIFSKQVCRGCGLCFAPAQIPVGLKLSRTLPNLSNYTYKSLETPSDFATRRESREMQSRGGFGSVHACAGFGMTYLTDHQVVNTSNYDEAKIIANRRWALNQKGSHLISRNYNLIFNEFKLHKSRLAYIEHGGQTKAYVEGLRTNTVDLWVHKTGHVVHRIDGEAAISSPDHIALHAPRQEFCVETATFSGFILGLDAALVQSATLQLFGADDVWTPTLLPSGATNTIRSLINWTAIEASNPTSLVANSASVAACVEKALLAAMMEALAVRGDVAEQKYLDEKTIREAEQWIDANLSQPIGVEDVAAMLQVNSNALRQTFYRLRGIKLAEAITLRRLDKAHAALRRAETGQTVTSIATELGFFELGRFAVRYRKRFGEKPSETLAGSIARLS